MANRCGFVGSAVFPAERGYHGNKTEIKFAITLLLTIGCT